jgi:hypothetical protein
MRCLFGKSIDYDAIDVSLRKSAVHYRWTVRQLTDVDRQQSFPQKIPIVLQ